MFSGKRVVVTGGGSGMGREIALEFGRRNAEVFILGRSSDKLMQTYESAKREGLGVRYSSCDVSNKEQVADYFEQFGNNPPQIVVNAAGVINTQNADGSQDDEATMQINYFGTFHVCEKAISALVSAGMGGAIVNIASIAGINGSGKFLTYSASKGAVISYTKGLARMYGKYGIRVNAISPGVIVTPMSYVENPKFDDGMERRIQQHPVGRVGTVKDIASAAMFLASDEASFITGQNLVVDGGLTI